MGGDCAEIAASETAPVSGDGVLYHIVGRDSLALVPRMRKFCERQIPVRIHLLLRGRRIGGIDLDVSVSAALADNVRMHHIGQCLNMMKVLGKGTLVLQAFLE